MDKVLIPFVHISRRQMHLVPVDRAIRRFNIRFAPVGGSSFSVWTEGLSLRGRQRVYDIIDRLPLVR